MISGSMEGCHIQSTKFRRWYSPIITYKVGNNILTQEHTARMMLILIEFA